MFHFFTIEVTYLLYQIKAKRIFENHMPTLLKDLDAIAWAKLYLTCTCCIFIAFSVTFQDSYNIFATLLICSYAFLISPDVRREIKLNRVEKSLIIIMLIYIAPFIMEVILFGSNIRILDKPAKVLLLIPLIPLLNAARINYRYLLTAFIISSGLLLCMAGYDKYILGYQRAGQEINALQFGAIAIAISSVALAFTAALTQHPLRHRFYLILLVTIATSGLMAGIISQSRGSIIAIPISLILISLLYFPRLNLNKTKTTIAIGICLILSSALIYNSSVMKRFQNSIDNAVSFSQGSRTNTSSGIRLGLWKVSLEAGLTAPVIGMGQQDFVDYKNKQVKLGHYGRELKKFDNSHNTYVNAFARRGLIGLSAVILFLGFPIYFGIQAWRREPQSVAPYAVGLTAFGSVFFISNITQEIIFLNTGIIMYTGLLVILTSLLSERIKTTKSEEARK